MAPAHQYNDVRLDDGDDRSSTEVGSLMEVEKQWQAEGGLDRPLRRSRTRRLCDTFNQWRWLIDTTLLLVILVFVLRLQTPGGRPAARSKADQYQLNGDMTDFSPRFDQKIVKFAPDDEYAPYNMTEFFKPDVLDKWNQLMPKGMGFQEVKDPGNPKYHDMPTPIAWPNATVYTTSMTHQLHCLWAVVKNYALLRTNQSMTEDHHWHMIHCFSYLRQGILCSADTALEGLETTFPEALGKGGSDGWDAHHVCKNREQVHDYLESVRVYDDQEIF